MYNLCCAKTHKTLAFEFSVIIDDDGGDHIADLKVSGTVKITFTPSPGSSDINGIPLRYRVSITDESVKWPTEIADEANNINAGDEVSIIKVASTDWVNINGGVNTLTYEFNASELGLSLGGSFYLPTYEKFIEFRDKLNSLSIKITAEQIPETPIA